MQIDNEVPKHSISYYGKKILFLNPLIELRAIPTKKHPEYENEDVKDKDP